MIPRKTPLHAKIASDTTNQRQDLSDHPLSKILLLLHDKNNIALRTMLNTEQRGQLRLGPSCFDVDVTLVCIICCGGVIKRSSKVSPKVVCVNPFRYRY
jgi:hypothetical protein